MNAPFAIYVHWPFCAQKCPYCDFNSHVRAQVDDMDWARAIARELAHVAACQDPEQSSARPIVSSVFFGGGTPSLMRGAAAGHVLESIARLWRVANDLEVTLEANPASADAARFAEYRAAGINRLSLGVQALNDADLKFLGRLHNVAEARAALALARKSFARVSLDLIYARPDQTATQWEAELKEALSFGTEHLSLYQLTIEEATPFALRARAGEILTPPDERAAELYELTQAITADAGRPAYEISNHAAPGAECRHNRIYWRYGAYAGVGPGAHGRLDLNGARIATSCERLPERWAARVAEQGHGITEQSTLTQEEAATEHLLMNLRLSEGLELEAFAARWHWAPERARIAALVEGGFLALDGTTLKATATGRLVLNRVIAELV